jgi:hypothetical protein
MIELFGAILGIIGLVISVLKVIAPILLELGKKMGLVNEKENVEDFGEKALQADKEMEDFSNPEEYMEYIKNIEIDEAKRHSEKEQLEKTCQVMEKTLEKEFEEFPTKDFASFVSKNEEYFTPEKMSALYDTIDKSEFKDIIGVLNGSVSDIEKIDSAIEILAAVEKKINPALSDDEAKLNVIEARRQ